MAGHSKWANIQHRKGRQDEKRGAAFSKIAKEITVAAKMGGGDAAFNPRLRVAIDKGKAINMPKDKIDTAIKKGTGELEGVDYIEVRYEGYGIGGAAVMVDCLTDNKTRTVADVRHAFNKYGGNMGTDGCVAFQFTHCGQLLFAPGTDEAALMDAAIEAGAPLGWAVAEEPAEVPESHPDGGRAQVFSAFLAGAGCEPWFERFDVGPTDVGCAGDVRVMIGDEPGEHAEGGVDRFDAPGAQ